jgi:hypothetical protein
MDQGDAADLLNLIRTDLGLHKSEKRFPKKGTLLAIYSRCVNTGQSLEKTLNERFPWCSAPKADIKRIFEAYTERKAERNLVDYDDLLLHWDQQVAPHDEGGPPVAPGRPLRKKIVLVTAGIVGVAAAAYFGIPWIVLAFTTVSTDDAYVNGHVTFVAARVPGQVKEVLVDDNVRVKKGDKLVLLDKEPYQVQVNIKKAAVVAAERDRALAEAQVVPLPSGPWHTMQF